MLGVLLSFTLLFWFLLCKCGFFSDSVLCSLLFLNQGFFLHVYDDWIQRQSDGGGG